MAVEVAWWLRLRLRSLRERFGVDLGAGGAIREHLAAVIDWLRRAQDVTPDAGVAQTWFVKHRRWGNSYPETTGYIIPTFYRYAELVGDADARHRARRMAEWECEIQLPDGGVVAGALGDSERPTVFNTGQVLFGWVRAFEVEDDARYSECALGAARWLCMAQDDDGCWRRFGSPMTGAGGVNTYNTRTAWALARAHAISGEPVFLERAIRNCQWALTQAAPNGWLAANCLQDPGQPFVHTVAYAMRGLLEVGDYARRGEFVEAAVRIGDALIAALPRDGFLPGRFDADWRPTVAWSCLTGNAQLAINWGRLYQITGEPKYREAVLRINGFTKRTQRLDGPPEECGGIKGSHPIDGGYHSWQYPNWAAKFFADALMMEEAITVGDGAVQPPFPG